MNSFHILITSFALILSSQETNQITKTKKKKKGKIKNTMRVIPQQKEES